MSIINATTGAAYPTVSAAITASADGDVIDIPAGLYVEEFPLITHSLTLQGIGGFAHLMTPNPVPANNRAILFVAGNANADLTVRNLELSGARDGASNGAGILFEIGNRDLRVFNSWFHDNQDGILGCSFNCRSVTIRASEFDHNGLAPSDPRYGLSHNLYIGNFDSLIVTDSYFHDALGGHEIKSRAQTTLIANNRIQDGPTADTSYSIDTPNGGQVTITGNVIEKGAGAINRYAIHFGGEAFDVTGQSYPGSSLLVSDNLIIGNRLGGTTAIYNQSLDPLGNSFAATAFGNTTWNVEEFYRDRAGAPLGPNDRIGPNTALNGIAPALDTSHPWDSIPEPTGMLTIGLAILAGLRRRRQSNSRKDGNAIRLKSLARTNS